MCDSVPTASAVVSNLFSGFARQASRSYLKRFPIDTLKIDQSFVRDIVTDPDDGTIVSAIIGMGQNLNQHVIPEGVETPEQLEFLRAR